MKGMDLIMKRKLKITILALIMVFTTTSCTSLLGLGALGLMLAPLAAYDGSSESSGCRNFEVIGGNRRCID